MEPEEPELRYHKHG